MFSRKERLSALKPRSSLFIHREGSMLWAFEQLNTDQQKSLEVLSINPCTEAQSLSSVSKDEQFMWNASLRRMKSKISLD